MKNAGPQGQALVLGSDTRSFLAVVRSLGRNGVFVHVAGLDANSPALWSRYIRKVHVLPSFEKSRDQWCEAVRRVLTANRFDIIIPCNDPQVLRFVYYTSKYGTVNGLELPSASVLEVASSKQRSHEMVLSLGIPVVRSRLISSRDELAAVVGALRPPVVLKPLSSFSVQDTLNRQEVQKAFSGAEALSLGSALLDQGAIQVQENFVGSGTGVEFLASNGRILCAFQHIRLHEPPHGGGSSYRKSIPLDERMLKSTEVLVAALKYDGVGMAEYKWNLKTNDYVFIEINARFWGSLPLAVASGANFPWYLYLYRVHGETKFPNSFKTGVCCRHWTLDVEWFKANARYSRKDPFLATKPWPTVLAELGNCFLGRERIDTLTLDDPRPFLREIAQSFAALCGAVGRKARRRLHSTVLYRRTRHHRLGRLLARASTVEFVCYGNICRSPFAAKFLEHQMLSHGGSLRVGSSGFHTAESRHSPEAAVTVAQEFGIDLSVHRSRRITSAIVEKADLVFVFDWQNFESFSKEFPRARDKLYLTGEMDPRGGSLTIQDPYGHGTEVFRATFSRISQLIEELLLRCAALVRR